MLYVVHSCQNPNCKKQIEATVRRGDGWAPCPHCGQRYQVPHGLPELTGRCKCGAAYDDHIWRGAEIAHCP